MDTKLLDKLGSYNDWEIIALFHVCMDNLLPNLLEPFSDVYKTIPRQWTNAMQVTVLLKEKPYSFEGDLTAEEAAEAARAVLFCWASDSQLSPILQRHMEQIDLSGISEKQAIPIYKAILSILTTGAERFSFRDASETVNINRKLTPEMINALNLFRIDDDAIHFVRGGEMANGGGSGSSVTDETLETTRGGGLEEIEEVKERDAKNVREPGRQLEVSNEDKDDVLCSVYAPRDMAPGDDEIIQAWLHLLEQSEDVEAEAKMVDENAARLGRKYLSAPLETGDKVQLILSCKDLEIDDATQESTWNRRPELIEFLVSIPDDFQKSKLIFRLDVFHNTIPIGKILFKINIGKATTSSRQEADIEADQYEEAFVSYSSADRDEVLKRVQGIKATGKYRIFQDVICLDPGDRWEKELYKNIDKCDVLFLFWSNNAKGSKWVKAEVERALKRKNGDDGNPPRIQPVPLEKPVVRPWDELGHMHFNDQILYFISE